MDAAGTGMPEPAAVSHPELVAYRVSPERGPRIEPAPRHREWIDRTTASFARRCLPLLIANQSGWVVESRHRVTAMWHGGEDPGSLRVSHHGGVRPHPAESHFGYGILTWTLPYLFRTPPGYNLLVRGPANWPKDGASPLEGVVETDWAVATFTVNWKLTRPGLPVTFEPGEPICMLVPQRRGEIEAFTPSLRDVDRESLRRQVEYWSRSRADFLASMREPGWQSGSRAWQKHYFQGKSPDGDVFADHQRKLAVRPFRDSSTATGEYAATMRTRGAATRGPDDLERRSDGS